MKRYNGSISIYFTFAIVIIISVIMSVTEIARVNCQKLYLQLATDAGLDSMASLYHRNLYEYYSLYGVEYKTKDLLETEYLSYIEPYFTDGDAYIDNWYVARIDEDHIDLNFKTLLDENYLEKEIVNYMKQKIIGKGIKFFGESVMLTEENDMDTLKERIENVFKETEKNEIYGEIYERYFDFESLIRNMEDHARTIMTYVDTVNIRLNAIKAMSTSGTYNNGKSISSKMESLLKEAKTLKNALRGYEEKMGELKERIYASRDRYYADKNSGNYEFTDDVCDFIESEFDRFISYVDDYSDMQEKIDEGRANIENIERIVEEDKRNLDTYVSELKDITDEITDERKKSGEERDNDYIAELVDERKGVEDELKEFLKELKETYEDYKMEQIEIIVSSSTHTSESNLLEKLISMKNGVVIDLVLNDEEIGKISTIDQTIRGFNVLSNADALSIDKILLGEYELDKFNYYNKEKNNEIVKSGSTSLEVERLIAGKGSDLENIKMVINKILLMRIGLDVLYIYTNPDKREAVRAFTMAVFSGFSPLLAEAMFLVVLTAWGTAQALVDVKKILDNKRVSFMHSEATWSVSISDILDIARNGVSNDDESSDDTGFALDYKDYLRLLLISTKQKDINSRMVGIIEKNIQNVQSNFDFSKLIYSFDTKNDFSCRHLFTNFVFVPAKDVVLYDEYKIPINAYRSFYD